MKIRPPKKQFGARATLRRACNASHQRMHDLEPFAQIATGTLSMVNYRRLLQALFTFHATVGAAAHNSGLLRVSCVGRRLDLLRADLTLLGASVPVAGKKRGWRGGEVGAVFGALYVAEGSMFGGRVIARQLDYAFGASEEGRRFFIGDPEDRANWDRLLPLLEDSCADRRILDGAIRGANHTFAWFDQCVSRNLKADPQTFFKALSMRHL